MSEKTRVCSVCGKILTYEKFYKSNNPTHGGYAPMCKMCVNKIVDSNDITSVYSFLKNLDIPFIRVVWERHKNKNKPMGAYLREINSLKQYEGMRWKDSIFDEDNILPKDDVKIYSKKWHGYYTQSEIEYLDEYLDGLMRDFVINTTSHIDYAKKIAQASLATNNAYQAMIEGIPGADNKYKSLQKVFDDLSQSAKFAEASRSKNDVGLGSFGKVFEMVERNQWIPHHIPLEKDDIDKILDYYANIERSL